MQDNNLNKEKNRRNNKGKKGTWKLRSKKMCKKSKYNIMKDIKQVRVSKGRIEGTRDTRNT